MTEQYRLLGTGSRRVTNEGRQLVREHCELHWKLANQQGRRLVIVQGACHLGGIDLEFARWGREKEAEGYWVTVEDHPAIGHPTQDFGRFPSAGPKRNEYMVFLGADHCVGILYACNNIYCKRRDPHGSHGADNCLRQAKAAHIPITRIDLWKSEN